MKTGGAVGDGTKCDAVTGAALATDVACKAVKVAAAPGTAEACDYTAAADTTDKTECAKITADADLVTNAKCIAVIKKAGGGAACTYVADTRKYSYQCDAGFICFGGSLRPEPTDEVTGSYCPIGGYCPAGVNRDRA